MKKLLILLFALCGLLAFSFCLADDFYKYEVQQDGTAIITYCYFQTGEVVIPEELDGIRVTSIGEYSFADKSLTRITIPSSVVSVSDTSFFECDKLTEFCVSEDNPRLEAVDGVLFDKVEKKLISYPTGKDTAVYNVPDGTKKIAGYAFFGNQTINKIFVPDGLTCIGTYAMANCISLSDFMIPMSVEEIGPFAFTNCPMSEIHCSEGNFRYETIDGVLYDKAEHALIYYPKNKGTDCYVVPDGIKVIGDGAFYACTGVKEVVLPEGIVFIGESAFELCTALRGINLPEGLINVDYRAFCGCSALENMYIPGSVRSMGLWSFSDGGFKTLTLGEGITEIDDYAFTNNRNLESIIISNGVTSIGDYAFSGCRNLKDVTIPKSVKKIGKYAFDEASKELVVHGFWHSAARKFAKYNYEFDCPDEPFWYNSKYEYAYAPIGCMILIAMGMCIVRYRSKKAEAEERMASMEEENERRL